MLRTPIVLLTAWSVVVLGASAETKLIRLRNERIATPDAPAFSPAAVPNATAQAQNISGLHLIQFRNHLTPSMRLAIEAHHVQLLKYVPDDAFIARLDNANPAAIRALPFVRWLGEYRADHKLDDRLIGPVGMAGVGDINVTLMLAPGAPDVEQAGLRRVFSKLQQESHHRFGGVMRGRVARGRLQQLAQSPGVLWIEPGPRMKLVDEIASELVGGVGLSESHKTFTQDYGFDGRGVTVSVADSGLHSGNTNFMHADLVGRVSAFFFYGGLTDAMDEHSHGTHVTGIIAGNGATGEADEAGNRHGLGVASGASIVAQRLFDGAGEYYAPPSFEVLTHDAVRAGAEIGSNSWGDDTQGRYDVSAAEFDALVRDADAETVGDQQYILEFSAGNAGPGAQTIGSPAVAKNVIASGAAQNNRFDFFIYEEGQEAMADFSSRGPCEDGRIKPDVVAPGTWIASLRSPFGDDNNAWADISPNYMYQGGTSQSGPHVSGAAAVFVQYYRQTFAIGTPSPALVKAALINSAVDMDDAFGTEPTPNNDEGWGRVDLTGLVLSIVPREYVDQSEMLTTGQSYERQVIVASANYPLVITLAYTDVPGFPAAIPALVNDLDLELIGPDGRIYRGNQFFQGESVPDAPSFDSINNVEGIYIDTPAPGEYRLRIIGRNIVEDARRDTPAPDQDFALVVSADIPPPEFGAVLLDRAAYRAPGRIQIKVIDLDLAGTPSIPVTVRSATEPLGETVTLLAAGGSGVMTGSIATAVGPPLSNGILQIANGDWITVEYFDTSEGITRSAMATADLMPPSIINISVTNRFGQTVVSWETSEPATAIVRFGTNSTLSRSATNRIVTTMHEVELTDLIVGRTYFYRVESTDLAGNTATNPGGGMVLNFVAQPAATVLLINAYNDDSENSIFIPVSTYTATLDQIGVTYEVWNTATRPLPTFANLRPYRIVMWRVNDSFWVSDSIPTAQQNAIQQYLTNGGAFFMASMEILSRLGPTAFRTNVLQAQQFVTNPDPFSQCPTCDEDFKVPQANGITNDPITSGAVFTPDYSQYPDFEFLGIGPDVSDVFGPTTNAATILVESSSGRTCGIRYPRTGQDSAGRVVFMSLPLDGIPVTGPQSGTRAAFLRNAIQFLAPGLDGFGTISLDAATYRLPGLITVEVADSDLIGLTNVTVTLSSDSVPTPGAFPIFETIRPGLFRGFIPLRSATNPPAPGILRALPGDTIHVRYFDASGNLFIDTRALVDATPPLISGLDAAPGYTEAFITWQTSEPTDALVQYGESAFLGRTAYEASLSTDHEIILTGLTPDRLYYYQVVSRDAAGNTVVDDNSGALYTFQTKLPLPAPWFTSLEMGSSNWTVENGEDSLSQWELGSPNNGLISSAYSPANCWGSSLLGQNTDTIDTFLISPAIDLTGGNVATLRFWNTYDFTGKTSFDLFEGGALYVITNSITAPVLLAEFSDANGFWEEEEIDLTPHVGKVVQIVWHHQLLAFENAYRPGWLLDDVSIVMSNIPPGIVLVSNNLAQARYQITGAMARNGSGWGTPITNATPGIYRILYSSVPYYQTPAAQTNVLAPSGSISFVGNYTFTDANTNGMADSWETQYFGGISPTRNRFSDTDGDGFTDYAEFIAGTNPNLPNSVLKLNPVVIENSNSLRFTWSSVAGRAYRILGTLNLTSWTPLTSWIQASSGSTTTALPPPYPGTNFTHFRLEVRP